MRLTKSKIGNSYTQKIINYLMADISEYEHISKKIKQEERPLRSYL
jgi:hypothetical protein